MEINLSELDKLRFGVVTAKAKINETDSVDDLIHQAKSMNVELLIVRFPTNGIEQAQNLERSGAILTDTLVYFQKKKIERYKIELPVGYLPCSAKASDAESVESIARESFKGYFGHYHADSRLNRVDCDAVYSSWARDSCGGNGLSDEVLIIKKDGEVAAFATLKVLSEKSYEGVLFGVAPNHQGKGLYLGLMKMSQNWGSDNDKSQLLTSTQITNVTVQKNWCRVGMEPLNSFYTYHLWLSK
jgi:hypothetical protein